MIEIIEVSPNNEEPVAKRLAASIRAAWPEVASSAVDRVTIAVGLQTLRDIDLLVPIELSEPRTLPPDSGGTEAARRKPPLRLLRSSSK